MAKPSGKAVQLPLSLEMPAMPGLDEEEKLAAALAEPLIVYPGGWDCSLPEWLRQAVAEERLARAGSDNDGLATLAEVLCYLFTAGLAAPLNHEWAEIYVNLAAQYMAARGATLPDDMQQRALTGYEERLLQELRRDIRRSQEREVKKERRGRRRRE